jgi:hypothetical protein
MSYELGVGEIVRCFVGAGASPAPTKHRKRKLTLVIGLILYFF